MPYLSKALGIYENNYGHDGQELVAPIIALANAHNRTDRRWQAEPYYRRAHGIIARVFGDKSVEQVTECIRALVIEHFYNTEVCNHTRL